MGGERRVGCVCRQRGDGGVCGDGRMSSMGAVGQRRGVDVVVVHDRAGQHQLEQTGGGKHVQISSGGTSHTK